MIDANKPKIPILKGPNRRCTEPIINSSHNITNKIITSNHITETPRNVIRSWDKEKVKR